MLLSLTNHSGPTLRNHCANRSRHPGFTPAWAHPKLLIASRPRSIYLVRMDWQELVALSLVALTASAFGWSKLRRRPFRFGRDTHCGCSAPSQTTPQHSIVFHARKGERPRMTLKMK